MAWYVVHPCFHLMNANGFFVSAFVRSYTARKAPTRFGSLGLFVSTVAFLSLRNAWRVHATSSMCTSLSSKAKTKPSPEERRLLVDLREL